MSRAKFLHIATWVVTVAACVAGLARFHPTSAISPAAAGAIAIALLSTAAGLALATVMTLRGEANAVAAAIASLADRLAGPEAATANDGSLGAVATNHLGGLTRSASDLANTAVHAAANAAMRVKQIEIELKVATAERQHAEAIIHSISDAVLVTSRFDEVLLANEAAAKTFDFPLDCGPGRTHAKRCPVDQLLKDGKMVGLIKEMRQSNSRNERRIIEHMVTNKAGEEKTYKVTLSAVADSASTEPAGVVAVLHDVTKEKEVAEMKNDFVSNVSHELRTPLASIKAYVEMLIDGEADDQRTRTEFYDVISNEANRLGRLIDNILNISRIESGLVKVNKQAQSVSIIAKEAADVINPQAKAKQITLVERLAPVFYQAWVDHDMLYQAMLNLLSNAVKYTPDGGTVTLATVVDETKRIIAVRISDTGVGIPPKDLPLVFDKFYRVEANNKMAKGTGLGLSLVKHIVETVHHGRILVESEVGKGSTFGFELALAE